MTSINRPRLAHVGIFVRDLAKLEKFYTSVFDLVVTDRGVGPNFGHMLIFLSGNHEQHHQLVLSGGRGEDTPSTVMQLSFKLTSLDELRGVRDRAIKAGATNFLPLNHGNAWSVYFDDPEGNRIEIYLDTPFHTPQPCGDRLDLGQSDEAIFAATKALIERLPGGMARADYVGQMQARMAKADG